MNNENQVLESIWADGIPANIKKEDVMLPIDILKLCIKFTVEQILLTNDYKIIGVIEDLHNFPNVTAEKDGKRYGIVVLPEIYPHFGGVPKDFRLQFSI